MGALDVEHPHFADIGAAAVLTPRTRAEVGGGHGRDPVGGDGGASFGIDLGRFGQAFRGRHDGRKLHHPFALAVVLLAQDLELALAEIEALHARDEGQVEQFRHLGADLAGVGVDRVAAGEDEVERSFALEYRRQRSGGCQRVRPGELRVGDEHARVGSPGDRLAQRVLGCGRPERDDLHAPPVAAASSTPLLTARRQYGFSSSSRPSRTRRPSARAASLRTWGPA